MLLAQYDLQKSTSPFLVKKNNILMQRGVFNLFQNLVILTTITSAYYTNSLFIISIFANTNSLFVIK
jgi:hypothetical protein